MKLSDSLSLTAKGEDEVKNRTHKLDIRHRSVIISFGKTQTFEYILQKQQLFNQKEATEIINNLVNDGFVAINGEAARRAEIHAPSGNIQLADGFIMSEAKFLLVDFCVDSFGTQSQNHVDELGVCKSEKCLQLCLKNIYATTEMLNPERLLVLLKIITEINATA